MYTLRYTQEAYSSVHPGYTHREAYREIYHLHTPSGRHIERYTTIYTPQGSIIGGLHPILTPSGRHNREVYTLDTPLREAYMGGLPFRHTPQGGIGWYIHLFSLLRETYGGYIHLFSLLREASLCVYIPSSHPSGRPPPTRFTVGQCSPP